MTPHEEYKRVFELYQELKDEMSAIKAKMLLVRDLLDDLEKKTSPEQQMEMFDQEPRQWVAKIGSDGQIKGDCYAPVMGAELVTVQEVLK